MGEVTQAELNRLRREVEETRALVGLMVRQFSGKEWTEDRLQAWLDEEREHRMFRRAFSDEGVWSVVEHLPIAERLARAGFCTVDDLSSVPRSEVAQIPGVGRASIAKLDAALAERNLSWAEAS
jgi:hypothetical protein